MGQTFGKEWVTNKNNSNIVCSVMDVLISRHDVHAHNDVELAMSNVKYKDNCDSVLPKQVFPNQLVLCITKVHSH